MKKIVLLILITLLSVNLFAQQSKDQYFTEISDSDVTIKETRYIVPQKYKVFQINLQSLKQFLATVPLEFSDDAENNPVYLNLPMPNGDFAEFEIVNSPIMEEGLANQFPQIQTFRGVNTKDKTSSVRFDYTVQGFHAMIMSANHSTVYIDPYAKGNLSEYIVYYKKDYMNPDKMHHCEVTGSIENQNKGQSGFKTNYGDGTFRSYRLALAATGEYTSFHGGTVVAGQSAQVTTINRVNQVYERDFAIRLIFVANNSNLIYTNPGSPFSNFNAFALLSENQSICDSVIGNSNYDVGHVFSTGGGGLASLGVVCKSGSKAMGETGSSQPTGDAFDIDFVAHELGHQFGANHTFNNSCSGNRNDATAYEPGSGTTIMAYAGVCGPNVQNNSDDHFHTASIDEIMTYIIGSTSCASTISSSNSQITSVDGGKPSYTIPKSTPFVLTATATDPDGDALTYCWEQMDNETGFTQPPVSTSTGGPLFRSEAPKTSPMRYFPSLSTILANTTETWEVLPSVGRSMNFKITVRDNAADGGDTETDNVALTVDGNSGPFLVTVPNTSVTWTGATTQTVTWDVANTDNGTINCQKVDIYLSIDGGQTFPYMILSGTANDGTEDITVPNFQTSSARIMIKGFDNVFFDVSNTNFTINHDPNSAIDDMLSNGESVNIYPNPSTSNSVVTIEFSKGLSSNTTVKIHDIIGKEITEKTLSIGESQTKIELKLLKSGVYFAKISDEEKTIVKKIIVK